MVKKILFVCYGNSDRSPMAEAICRRLIREWKLEHKFKVDSAGISPMEMNASEKTRNAIIARYGEDMLKEHVPKRLTSSLIESSDYIFTMGTSHKEFIRSMGREERVWTLKEFVGADGLDIKDIRGLKYEEFLKKAEEFEGYIKKALQILNGPPPEGEFMCSPRDSSE